MFSPCMHEDQIELLLMGPQMMTTASSSFWTFLLDRLQQDGFLNRSDCVHILKISDIKERSQSLTDLVVRKGPRACRRMMFCLWTRDDMYAPYFKAIEDAQMKLLRLKSKFISLVFSPLLHKLSDDLTKDGLLSLRDREEIREIPDIRTKTRYAIDLVLSKGPSTCLKMLFFLKLREPSILEIIDSETSGTSKIHGASGKFKMKIKPSVDIFTIIHAEWLTGGITSTIDKSEWTKLEPEVLRLDGTWYRLQCGPGKFECRVSGLRWISSKKMSFKYRFGHWWEHKDKLEAMLSIAGGLLLDLTVNDGQFDDVYLPHWINIDDKTIPGPQLAVLCVHADGYIVDKVSEATSSHVRLPYPNFSVKGVIVRIGRVFGYRLPLKCKVLIYQTTKTFLTLHVYLILFDPALEEALDKKAHSLNYVKIEKPYPEGPLELDDRFSLKADIADAVISPDHYMLTDERRDPNFFEVHIQQPIIFGLRLENARGQVWRCMIRQHDYNNQQLIWPGMRTCDDYTTPRSISPGMSTCESALRRVRADFAARVSDEVINQLMDDLLGIDLNDGEKNAIMQDNPICTHKARALIDTVMMKGNEASRRMIGHLEHRDRTLHTHLRLPHV
uniref:NACHT, LRR and PYD domains-containing protein 1b allele 2-like isoform X2 n=1 Tax=Doryrhamphus excisus TaxID=161450 RepID=UPI0025AE5DBE|nr:NACHT, LRR and PYD domains-containing protein 1b allele 2-like isoform X2 [Doryrhamphus excisus]